MSAMPEKIYGEDGSTVTSEVLEVRSYSDLERAARFDAFFVHTRLTHLFVNCLDLQLRLCMSRVILYPCNIAIDSWNHTCRNDFRIRDL
jgi:hypothetical protein